MTEDVAVGWAWRTPLVGAAVVVACTATSASAAELATSPSPSSPSPSASAADSSAAPSALPSPGAAAQLQAQARRDAEALAAERAAQAEADARAVKALETFQVSTRHAEQAERAYQKEAAALRAAEAATAASRRALSQYLGSVYRTGVGNRSLSVLSDLMESDDPRALFDGLSVASRVGGNRNDQLDALHAAEQTQDRAAERAEAARATATAARTRAEAAKRTADAAVADAQARVAEAAATLLATQTKAQVAAEQEAALAAARTIAARRSIAPPLQALMAAATPRPEATCSGRPTTGFPNGTIPEDALCPLWGTSGHMLRADAAAAFDALSKKYAETFAKPICVTDSYRSYPEQVAVRKAKPTLAAVPGTSNHGWGVAVDLCDGVQTFGSPQHVWLAENAMAFGWFHPSWAQAGGSKPEAWHWEYAG